MELKQEESGRLIIILDSESEEIHRVRKENLISSLNGKKVVISFNYNKTEYPSEETIVIPITEDMINSVHMLGEYRNEGNERNKGFTIYRK